MNGQPPPSWKQSAGSILDWSRKEILVQNWFITTERKRLDYYKGLLIHADQGVHEEVLALCHKHISVAACWMWVQGRAHYHYR